MYLIFDTETTGLDKVSDHPIGVSLSIKEHEAVYIPLVDEHLKSTTKDKFIELLKPIFKTDKTKIAHNAKFDIQMLANIGIEVSGPIADTMIASWILTPDQRGYSLDHNVFPC